MRKLEFYEVIIYIIILAFVIFLIYIENKDLTCGAEGDGSTCNIGYSMATYPGIPKDSDTLQQTKDKIVFLSKYNENSIIWRRALINSIFAAFIVSYVLTKEFPRIQNFVAALIIIYAFLYVSAVIYKPLTESKAVLLIQQNLEHVHA